MLFLYFVGVIFRRALLFWTPRVLKLLLRCDDPETECNGESRYQIRFLAMATAAPVRNRSRDYV